MGSIIGLPAIRPVIFRHSFCLQSPPIGLWSAGYVERSERFLIPVSKEYFPTVKKLTSLKQITIKWAAAGKRCIQIGQNQICGSTPNIEIRKTRFKGYFVFFYLRCSFYMRDTGAPLRTGYWGIAQDKEGQTHSYLIVFTSYIKRLNDGNRL